MRHASRKHGSSRGTRIGGFRFGTVSRRSFDCAPGTRLASLRMTMCDVNLKFSAAARHFSRDPASPPEVKQEKLCAALAASYRFACFLFFLTKEALIGLAGTPNSFPLEIPSIGGLVKDLTENGTCNRKNASRCIHEDSSCGVVHSVHYNSSTAKRETTNGDSVTFTCLRPESTRYHSCNDSNNTSVTRNRRAPATMASK